jgi:AcrR family transcriptional regulator
MNITSTNGHNSSVPVRVVTHEQVIRAATDYFIRHSIVDIDGLARELSVGRATVYRLVGSRDHLMADVLRWGSTAMLDEIVERRRPHGVDAVVDTLIEHAEMVLASEPFRAFLAQHRALAFRVLFMPRTATHRFVNVRRVLVAAGIVDEERDPALLDDIAFAVVRICESMVYADLLARREPNVALTKRLLRAALQMTADAPDAL